MDEERERVSNTTPYMSGQKKRPCAVVAETIQLHSDRLTNHRSCGVYALQNTWFIHLPRKTPRPGEVRLIQGGGAKHLHCKSNRVSVAGVPYVWMQSEQPLEFAGVGVKRAL